MSRTRSGRYTLARLCASEFCTAGKIDKSVGAAQQHQIDPSVIVSAFMPLLNMEFAATRRKAEAGKSPTTPSPKYF
jgi:hypothetical protein